MKNLITRFFILISMINYAQDLASLPWQVQAKEINETMEAFKDYRLR